MKIHVEETTSEIFWLTQMNNLYFKVNLFGVFILNHGGKISLFFCFYTSLCIIISFRFVGRPGRYVYVFESYRMEEVSTYEIQIANKILYTKKYMYSAQWTTDNGKNRRHMLKQEVKSST